jgi:general stress protein 26
MTTTQETTNEKRKEALAFLKAHTIAAIATKSAEGNPHVRMVYYACDDAFAIYFLSLANTRKAADIKANKEAAFVVSSPDTHHTLQIEGVFEEMTDTGTFGPTIVSLTQHLFPKGEEAAPITHLDASHPVFFKLSPTWIRWGDFTRGGGNKEVFFEV